MHERNDPSFLPPQHINRIADILGALDRATEPGELDLPGYHLHELKADLAGFWAIRVSRNWRITFRFAGTDVTDVDFVDYH